MHRSLSSLRPLLPGTGQRAPRSPKLLAATTAAALAAALLLTDVVFPDVAAPAPAGPTIAASYLQQPVTWGRCSWWPASWEQYDFLPQPKCASVTVPRDWANPGQGPDLTIAISRVQAKDPANRKGILMTNPGGPGGNGVLLPFYLDYLETSGKLWAQYDVLGMDPRGVGGGGTTPLYCDVPVDPLRALKDRDSRDLSADGVATPRALAKIIADACAKNPLTPYINTWQTAHDMDLIRALLGEPKLNYLGYSYGTWLGAKYAALFPQNAGKMVLDSNTNWMDPLSETFNLQPLGFERRFRQQYAPWETRQWCDWCEPARPGPDLGTTPEEVLSWYEKDRAIYKKWYGDAAGNDLDDTIARLLYSASGFTWIHIYLFILRTWVERNPQVGDGSNTKPLGPVFDQAIEGMPAAEQALVREEFTATFGVSPDTATLDTLSQGIRNLPGSALLPSSQQRTLLARARSAPAGTTIAYNDVFDAVRCGDDPARPSENLLLANARKLGPSYPLRGYATSADVCSYWSLPATPLPNPDPSKVTLVSVQSELDPATPFEGTPRNLAQFRGLRLIGINDDGDHGQYIVAKNSCVNDAVNAYLFDGLTPPAQTICTGPRLRKAYGGLEDQVYPVTGPLDTSNGVPSTEGALSSDPMRRQVARLLNQLITTTGTPLTVPDLVPTP